MQKIQWYPGHMHKAIGEIRKQQKNVQFFMELRDARAPFSSRNPLLEEVREDKPVIVILTKTDLADPDLTVVWSEEIESENTFVGLASNQSPQSYNSVVEIVRTKLGFKKSETVPVAMVMGIPNVGKSTLINHLAGRQVARTGNEPAVTRHLQRVTLSEGFDLLDTPGMLWPNIENFHSGYRLAATGSVRDTALSHTEVAVYLLDYLLTSYHGELKNRYGEEFLDTSGWKALEEIGRSRGALKSGGRVDFDRSAKIVISDFRTGYLGGITLESPEMMAKEQQEVARERLEKQQKKQQRKDKFKKKNREN